MYRLYSISYKIHTAFKKSKADWILYHALVHSQDEFYQYPEIRNVALTATGRIAIRLGIVYLKCSSNCPVCLPDF